MIMTLAQRSAMHRSQRSPHPWRIERMVTAQALIERGLVEEVKTDKPLRKGMAISLTDKGRDWLLHHS